MPKKPSKLGFLQKNPPAVRHHYFLLGFRATPSMPTSTRLSSCFQQHDSRQGLPRRLPGFRGSLRALKGLGALPGLGGLERGLQVPGFRAWSPVTVFTVFPFKGKINVHCLDLAHWGGWRQGCAVATYGRSPERLYTSIFHRLLPLSYPVPSCLTTLVMVGTA